MKFGFRIPSLNKRIAARTSVKRMIRHNLGLKAGAIRTPQTMFVQQGIFNYLARIST